MSEKKWLVDLSAEERGELLGLIRKGKAAARRLTRAHILLLADEGRTDEEIAAALHTNRSTAERVRHRFVEEGLGAALSELMRLHWHGASRTPIDWGRHTGQGVQGAGE